MTFSEGLIDLRSIPGCICKKLHTATRLTLMLCILFRDEFSIFLLIQESCMFLAKSTREVLGG